MGGRPPLGGQGESHEGPLGWILAGLPGVGGVEGVGHALGSGSTGQRSDDGTHTGGGLPPGDLAHMPRGSSTGGAMSHSKNVLLLRMFSDFSLSFPPMSPFPDPLRHVQGPIPHTLAVDPVSHPTLPHQPNPTPSLAPRKHKGKR